MTVYPESVGGTPAGRMIHRESNQLFIGHYAVDTAGNVRVIPIESMPIRVTAIVRHLTDPANRVYYIDMEGSIWEANVHTLKVKRLFKKPVPGWHSKGGYSSQGRLVISNNGERAAGTYHDILVGGAARNSEERGVLAEFDGADWRIVERRQYTDVTGPAGIAGGSDNNEPIWAIGWDRRSLRLKVLDSGTWHTYLLPKAAFCNDAIHGWYTEWPRIREITDGRWMMDMHGMFFDFPKSFSAANSAGIKPIGSHLRYVPDFCAWNGKLVLATDETSIQGNKLAGQPQSNLWFGDYDDLKSWGPSSGYGGPWIEDSITAHAPSDPFLVAGFDRRVLHLAVGRSSPLDTSVAMRATGQQRIRMMPKKLAKLPRVTIPRGDWTKPAPGYHFAVNQRATVYLAVDQRGEPTLPQQWQATDMTLAWGDSHSDIVYKCEFPAGRVTIPGNDTEHTPGSFGMPHTAFISSNASNITVDPSPNATVTYSLTDLPPLVPGGESVKFRLQVDVHGDGQWIEYDTVEVAGRGFVSQSFPDDFHATWLRLSADRDCVATAVLHQTTSHFHRQDDNLEMFSGLADAGGSDAQAALVYAANRNRNLRVIDGDGRQFEFTKAGFEFQPHQPDAALAKLLEVDLEFTVDDASVVVVHDGQRLRLPKGNAAFDKPFASGWPRALREVESERQLANIHGTFYEVPLVINGAPPALDLVRPIASHEKQITDYCSWNGLLVLAGVRSGAEPGGHIFADPDNDISLWLGGIDDLWKFGKPVGKGGPWKNSRIAGGDPSDAYLMTGYDKKTLTLLSDRDTAVTIEVDVDHQSGWHQYRTLNLKAGEGLTYAFPPAFSAHWVRFIAADDCTATAQLVYE